MTNEDTIRESRELRDALDEFLERVTNLNSEEQSAEFIFLVSTFSVEALKQALLMTAVQTPGSSFTGRLPIHLACDKSASLDIIRYLLDSDTDKQSIKRPDKWGDLPIHTACSRRDSADVVKLLLDSDDAKTTIFTKDNNGLLPIHVACRYTAPPEVFQLLLESDPFQKSLLEKDQYGQLPLHTACRCNAPPEVISLLVDADLAMTSVLQQDDAGRIPLHVALLRSKHKEVFRVLLEGMICGRMERKGLLLWKQDMEGLLHSMATYERDFMTSDRLLIICLTIKDFMERAFLLELGIWRASCLVSFQTMQDIIDRGIKDETFDPCEYKKERRIKSGAEIIIRGVIPFLENEPIEKIMPLIS